MALRSSKEEEEEEEETNQKKLPYSKTAEQTSDVMRPTLSAG